MLTNVPVATGAATAIPAVTLNTAKEGRISGNISPITADENGSVQVLQRVIDKTGVTDDVVIEAAFANADATTGDYEVFVPQAAAKVAPHGGPFLAGDSGGLYAVTATVGTETRAEEASVGAGDDTVDFVF